MKRYSFEIHSALSPTIREINRTMHNFGFDGHAIGYKIGTVAVTIPELEKVDLVRNKIEKHMNEFLKKQGDHEIWLVNAGEIKESS